MQSARIWFQQSTPSITLTTVSTYLMTIGAEFEETSWSLGTFVVPQLYVIQPVPFLLQLNDDEYVTEEAKEFSEIGSLPKNIHQKLVTCDTRLEIGDVSENSIISDREITAFEGWTGFDPRHPKAQKILKLVTTKVHGILEDNVNGTWWST